MSEDARIAESVQRYGWHAIAVEGTERQPPFTYTIGLCDKFNHREVVIVGLDHKVAHPLLVDVLKQIQTGRTYRPGDIYRDLIPGYPVAVLPIHETQVRCRLGYAMAYYRRAAKPGLPRALQLLWPDRQGKLPNDPGCDEAVVRLQPLLDHEVPPSELREFMAKFGSISN